MVDGVVTMTQQLKIDSRVKILIENCIRTNQRSMFVVVGDSADYVVSWHVLPIVCSTVTGGRFKGGGQLGHPAPIGLSNFVCSK